MTTITIENSSLKFPDKFQTEKDLLEFLISRFEDRTFLIRTSIEELTAEEKKAWYKHKKDGYDDFVNFEG